MFQTDINHFFQDFSSDFFTAFMLFISDIGSVKFFIPAVIVLIFGVDFKRGVLVFQGLMLTAVLTQLFKNLFHLPRPLDVDNSLEAFAPHYNQVNTLFTRRDAQGFWESLPPDILRHYRFTELDSYGFPSGHTSTTVAFWGSLASVFQRKALWVTLAIMTILMGISRLYLPKHFLADVLGGFALAAVVLFFLFQLWLSAEKRRKFFESSIWSLNWLLDKFLITAVLFVFPLVVLFVSPKVAPYAAQWLGANIGFAYIFFSGTPHETREISHRVYRIISAFLIFALLHFLFDWILPENLALFAKGFEVFLTLIGVITLARKMRWYARLKESY